MKPQVFFLFLFMLSALPAFSQKKDAWGSTSQGIPGKEYAGKEFRYSAFIKKTGEGNGTAHLWLRVDRTDNDRGFIDNMYDRPVTSNEWQKYTIEGVIDENVSEIVFGILFINKGEFHYDNLTLEVKKNNGEWEQVPLDNGGFEDGLSGYLNENIEKSLKEKGFSFEVSSSDSPEETKHLVVKGTLEYLSNKFYEFGESLVGFWEDENGRILQYKWTPDGSFIIEYGYSGEEISFTSFIYYDEQQEATYSTLSIGGETTIAKGVLKDRYIDIEGEIKRSNGTLIRNKVSLTIEDPNKLTVGSYVELIAPEGSGISERKFKNILKRIEKPSYIKTME